MIVAVMMVRDEADIITHTLDHLVGQGVDHIVVANNLSVDETPDLLASWQPQHRLTVIDDPVLGYEQASKMSGLAHIAQDLGADWVLPCDADECWAGVDGYRIGEVLHDDLPAEVVKAWGWDHLAQPDKDDADEPNPFRRIGWRRTQQQRLPKVAFRAGAPFRLHMGNHDVDREGRRVDGVLSYRHFGFRSFEQMRTKVRNGRQACRASGLNEMYCAHWHRMGALSDADLTAEWDGLCCEPGLVFDPAPGVANAGVDRHSPLRL